MFCSSCAAQRVTLTVGLGRGSGLRYSASFCRLKASTSSRLLKNAIVLRDSETGHLKANFGSDSASGEGKSKSVKEGVG